MKILIEPSTKNNLYQDITTGIILSLDKYAVQSNVYFSLEEIKKIRNHYHHYIPNIITSAFSRGLVVKRKKIYLLFLLNKEDLSILERKRTNNTERETSLKT